MALVHNAPRTGVRVLNPYYDGRVPEQRPLRISNPGLEILQLPKQSRTRSKTLSEPDDVEKGYKSDPVEAYDVV